MNPSVSGWVEGVVRETDSQTDCSYESKAFANSPDLKTFSFFGEYADAKGSYRHPGAEM